MESFTDLVLIAGAIAWWSTALVHKDGPFNMFEMLRIFAANKVNTTVLKCTFCTGFWVGLIVILFWVADLQPIVAFFGILGFASAIRGASAEF